MPWLKKIKKWLNDDAPASKRKSEKSRQSLRCCRVETMEPRTMLSADPIFLGAVYIEQDLGSDEHGDTFEISFTGGADGTELTRVVINTDQIEFGNTPGFGLGDVFFDTAPGGLGTDASKPFQVVSLNSADPTATVTATVSDGGQELILEFTNFKAGDKLIFSIDVDEVLEYDPNETDLDKINDGFDPITSGREFRNSQLSAEFIAPHYYATSGNTLFVNEYDPMLVGTNLDLSPDNVDGKRDRTAGGVLNTSQEPLPISISGTVFEENNLDLVQDADEDGIANVQLALWRQEGNSYVFTGHTTQTDGNGDYSFGTDLGLPPGVYQVREAQPDGYLSVGAIPGTVADVDIGQIVVGNPDILTQVDIALGGTHAVDYDFSEYRPGQIHGNVHLTLQDDDCFDETVVHPPLEGVKIELFDKDGNLLETTYTNEFGNYSFINLLPGTYTVVETTPTHLVDSGERAGKVNGVTNGAVIGNDKIGGIVLKSGEIGEEYDFCERLPSEISGHVYHDKNDNGDFESTEDGIEGVTVMLLDENGTQVGTTTTDGDGFYRFTGLAPGKYTVMEVQPGGWIDGKDTIGQVDGISSGVINTNDKIAQIELKADDIGVNYDFGELLPAKIHGNVHMSDDMEDCMDENAYHEPIEGAKVELFDGQGNLLETTFTDANGDYWFMNLRPGTYSVVEHTPPGLIDGGEHAGTVGGIVTGSVTANDTISNIVLGSGDEGVHYDFCEHIPGSIAGLVHVDPDLDCLYDPGELVLGGVQVELVDAQGNVVAVTQTDAEGRYLFDNLPPGDYTVRFGQPDDYFYEATIAINGNGAAGDHNIASIDLDSGDHLTEYNLCVIPPVKISGYVFQDGDVITTPDGKLPANLSSIRDGQFTADDTPIRGVVLELRNGVTGLPVMGNVALPGIYGSGPIQTVTDANGYYQFVGLPAGSYAVYEIHPDAYHDSKDTPGTLSGVAFNVGEPVDPLFLSTLAVNPGTDAIVRINVGWGESSELNNFSEVLVNPPIYIPPPPETPFIPPPVSVPFETPFVMLPPLPPVERPQLFEGGIGGGYTWHLSVVDAGHARGVGLTGPTGSTVYLDNAPMSMAAWSSVEMNGAMWHFSDAHEGGPQRYSETVFGRPGSIPVAGDFNGDGVDEIGVFYMGEWFIDLDGNGQWDPTDLWARLGDRDDMPVTGDWDGDGKDDIGIFGPIWSGDPVAIERDPGLPDPHNSLSYVHSPKNLPPRREDATDGERLMQHTSQGDVRSDLIDHVFRFGDAGDVAVTGDWNGDGIASIGIFRDGRWYLDLDGDGRWGEGDSATQFGQPGDIPVVGDWTGNGKTDIGVYRGGTWILDANKDRELDATDRVFQMGTSDDQPVVGDFNGDGIDDPAIMSSHTPQVTARAGQ